MLAKDHIARQQALDPSHSFIVQAPAGSGKTELLSQRFLVLLSIVKQPEEVVAITFTRKAATEMRARILDALHFATVHDAPEKAHELQTWQLAKNVLIHDKKLNWNILQNPNRLRILTIDALCARVAKLAPLLSHFGSVPQIIDNPEPLYRETAELLLTSLNSEQPWVSALQNLLLHLDNNYLLAEKMFVGMLSRRDQWLPYVVNHRNVENSRILLEMGLQNIITDALKKAQKLFSPEEKAELLCLASYAGSMLKDTQKNSFISHCKNMTVFPKSDIAHLKEWIGIAQLLLTTAFDWRKTVNKNCGFLAASEALNQDEEFLYKNMKERMLRLLARLQENETLRLILKDILLLPPATYSENQWEIVSALTELLPILVAHLKIIFGERGVADFIAITEGAIHALGESDDPSDIALNLDYRIQHLLVDEFQDTSVTQYRLLELLTAGWQKEEGRTLFLVGDPMQSIYRFREAEVGIFLRVKHKGIGNIRLLPLTLEVNFRSEAPVVEWFNATFKNIFPQDENSELGAITFSPSSAFFINHQATSHVTTHPLLNPSENDEADCIVRLIQDELKSDANKTIAILVRSRSHLQHIIPTLKNANINFQAVEIEKLIFSSAVQDLLALTKALSHLADRIAWLAILRAPWCGLTLADLYVIANYDRQNTIWNTLVNFESIEALSAEGKHRIARIVPVLQHALNERSRETVRKWVAYTWYSLGGPACIDEAHELRNTHAYFQLLEKFSNQPVLDFKLFEDALSRSYSDSTSSHNPIHVMTIHKAKGLEFDVVIIPGLERKPAIDESRLLMWLERQNSDGDTDLILAPVKSLEDEYDPIYRYIRNQNTIKNRLEVTRLLYVAVTRAKKILHLVGSIYQDEDTTELKSPASGSFLNLLWPYIQNSFEFIQKFKSSDEDSAFEVPSTHYLKRLTLDWEPIQLFRAPKETAMIIGNNQFTWESYYLHHVGTVIHRFLQKLAELEGCLDTIAFDHEKRVWKKQLLQLGVLPIYLDESMYLIEKAIRTMLQDKRGKWILQNHQEAKNEFAVSLYINNEVAHYVIDRTFIDADNIRWIIDYKTAELLEENETSYLDTAKMRYREQLEGYAKAMRQFDNRPIKLALYFPLFSGWCEWSYAE